jgi:tetratricopeptide (TPR) repeat protein
MLGIWRARLARLNGDTIEFLEVIELASRLGAPRDLVRLENWLASVQAGDLVPSTEDLSQLLVDYPDHGSEIFSATSTGLLAMRRFSEAHDVVDFWEKATPQDPKVYYARGRLWESTRRNDLAFEAFGKAVELAPRWTDARLAWSDQLRFLRRHTQAIAELRKILEEDPHRLEAELGLAQILADADQTEEALKVLDQIIAREPSLFFSRLLRATLFDSLGNPAEVIASLEPLIERFPQDMELCFLLAQAYGAVEREEEALDFLERYRRGRAWTDNELKKMEKEFEENPSNGDLALAIGQGLLPIRFVGAIPWLRTASALKPNNPMTFDLLARAFELKGDAKEASECRQAMRRLQATKSFGKEANR